MYHFGIADLIDGIAHSEMHNTEFT